MVHFTEINKTPPPYSMLQDVGREATPKLATTDCLKYLQTTLIMGWGGLVSEFMWGIVDRAGNTTMFFIIEKAKETVLEFSQGTLKVL